MNKANAVTAAAAGVAALAIACASSGAGGREIVFTQTDGGCTPTSVSVSTGEKLKVTAKNESSNDVYEIEGIEGTKLEEFVAPQGKSRSSGYTVPGQAGTYKLKCYVPAGPSTIIELVAGEAAGAGSPGPSAPAITEAARTSPPGEADSTVAVTLVEYSVQPDKASVPAGKVRFIATNASASMVHELAVLRVLDDGGLENVGEVEDVAAGEGGAVTLDLAPGAYQLACLIAPGEAGSTVDHYQQGMHTGFTVTG